MKNFFFLVFLMLSLSIKAQLTIPFSIEGIIGARLNILNYHGNDVYAGSAFVVTSPMLGLKISHHNSPFSLSFMQDRSYFFRHYPSNDLYNIQEINVGNMLRFQYQAKRFRYGLGHYWSKEENPADFFLTGFGFGLDRRYIAFAFAVPFGNAEVEFQSLMQYDLFDIGDWFLQEINFKYYLGQNKNKEKKYPHKKLVLNFLLGGRLFTPDQPYLTGERKVRIATAVTIGAELLATKYRTGIYWEKDWWLALNGGSPNREVKGQINTTVLGVKYHHPLKGDKSLNIGIGYAGIMDASTIAETATKISKGLESEKLFYTNIRGVSFSPSFDFNKHLRVELRQIIATKGERGVDLERFSLGVFYKILP